MGKSSLDAIFEVAKGIQSVETTPPKTKWYNTFAFYVIISIIVFLAFCTGLGLLISHVLFK